MNSTSLLLSVFFSALGAGYFVYGRKQDDFPILISGLILMVYPYVVSNAILQTVVGLAVAAAPFIIRRFDS